MVIPKEGEEQITRTFNPNDHLMQIKNRNGSADYLPVQWRLVWFREHCPDGVIETEMVHLDLDRETEEEGYAWNNDTKRSEKVVKRAMGFAVFKATVKDGKGGIATGTKSEKAASFGDYIEKAETGAIGRALAALGYGTAFAPELDESPRIVDSPVDRSNTNTGSQSDRKPLTSVKPSVHTTATTESDMATDQQLSSIRKLNQYLGKPEPENMEKMAYLDAKTTITALSTEYNERKRTGKGDAANAAKRDLANAPLLPKQLTELKSAFAVTFGIDGAEVNKQFERWVAGKLQGNLTPDTLTIAQFKPLMDLIDQHATAQEQEAS